MSWDEKWCVFTALMSPASAITSLKMLREKNHSSSTFIFYWYNRFSTSVVSKFFLDIKSNKKKFIHTPTLADADECKWVREN